MHFASTRNLKEAQKYYLKAIKLFRNFKNMKFRMSINMRLLANSFYQDNQISLAKFY